LVENDNFCGYHLLSVLLNETALGDRRNNLRMQALELVNFLDSPHVIEEGQDLVRIYINVLVMSKQHKALQRACEVSLSADQDSIKETVYILFQVVFPLKLSVVRVDVIHLLYLVIV